MTVTTRSSPLQVAAIILAAGASRRFGQPKQLLPWQGKPLLVHIADVALASQARPVIVVLGSRFSAMRRALGDRPLQIVHNPRWPQGLSTSVRAGLAALPPEADAALFLQADQPGLTAALLDRLIARFRQGDALIVAPAYQGRRGTPVLFARPLFDELRRVQGDRGGRGLLQRYADRVALVEVDSPLLLADFDTPEEWAAWQQAMHPP
ncbi:MAG: nucleotidyltransferase family protein [Chloroflexi bacterium]|nr:MAG: nucleotidyltransferase family protein [Chloroflexota bacterium]